MPTLAPTREPSAALIQEQLGYGKVVHAERRTGKTTALALDIHYKHHGKAVVMFIARTEAENFKRAYKQNYPQDVNQPFCIAGYVRDLNTATLGNQDPIYVDDWWLHREDVRNLLNHLCKVGRPIVGVGTAAHLQTFEI